MADTDQDSKVFDVAKPGAGKTNIGSKPMIIGHKTLAEDPMVKEDKEKKEAKEPLDDDETGKPAPPSVSKKVITPPSQPSKEEKKEPEEKAEKPAAENEGGEEVDSDQNGEESPEKNTVDPEVEKNERNEKLQKMVDSKKYFVTVHESNTSHTRTFVVTFILGLIIGVAAIAVLIDAEIIDIGINLPFDLL